MSLVCCMNELKGDLTKKMLKVHISDGSPTLSVGLSMDVGRTEDSQKFEPCPELQLRIGQSLLVGPKELSILRLRELWLISVGPNELSVLQPKELQTMSVGPNPLDPNNLTNGLRSLKMSMR